MNIEELNLEAEIAVEYERFAKQLEPNEPMIAGTLNSEEVLAAHFMIANQFYLEGEGLGGIGPKSIDLLQSAVYRQFTAYGDILKWGTPHERCATLMYGLILNHPFHDANKRTAFLSALLSLNKNNLIPSVSERQFEDFTVHIADKSLQKLSRYKGIVQKGDPDPEVRFIAWYLKNNTRQVDKTHYAITFRELKSILNRFGYSIENPNKNYIDVVKIEKKKRLFQSSHTEKITKIGKIGFPRWTSQVSREEIRKVRELTKLDYKNYRIDSAEFYKGVLPVQSLIASYHEPLRRLAYR